MATGDFAQKLGVVLKATNLSRGRLAQSVGIDKSVVSRWASGVQVPTDHNLSLLTEAVARHQPGFARRDWDLDADAFAARLVALETTETNPDRKIHSESMRSHRPTRAGPRAPSAGRLTGPVRAQPNREPARPRPPRATPQPGAARKRRSPGRGAA